MLVHFKGGPWGGETRNMMREDFTGTELRVAVHYRLNPLMVDDRLDPDPVAPSNQVYDTERYRLERQLGPNEFEARWIPPHLGIRKKLDEVAAKLSAAEFEIEELREELRGYEELKELVESLQAIAKLVKV